MHKQRSYSFPYLYQLLSSGYSGYVVTKKIRDCAKANYVASRIPLHYFTLKIAYLAATCNTQRRKSEINSFVVKTCQKNEAIKDDVGYKHHDNVKKCDRASR